MGITPEGRIKKKVNLALKKLGKHCWRFCPVQSGFGTVALDYLLCIGGMFVAIETKAPGKKPTPLQESTMSNILAAGGLVFLVDGDESLNHAIDCIKNKSSVGNPA